VGVVELLDDVDHAIHGARQADGLGNHVLGLDPPGQRDHSVAAATLTRSGLVPRSPAMTCWRISVRISSSERR
jgi:hypothetical protein